MCGGLACIPVIARIAGLGNRITSSSDLEVFGKVSPFRYQAERLERSELVGRLPP